MPFDGKTWKEHEPFSLESLIAWLEQQPAEERYDFSVHDKCVWGLYVAAHDGRLDDCMYVIGSARISAWFDNKKCWRFRVAHPAGGVDSRFLGDSTGTFGAALERARAIQAALVKA